MSAENLKNMSNSEMAAAVTVHVHDGPQCDGDTHDDDCDGFEIGCYPLPVVDKFVCLHLPIG